MVRLIYSFICFVVSLNKRELEYVFSFWVKLNIPSFQIEYDAHYTQLNFLKTLSNYANQNVTYSCRKSKAWEDGQHSIKLMGSNEMQYHATSKISLRPNVITNECTVSWQFARSLVRNTSPFTIHSLEQPWYGYNLDIHFYSPTNQSHQWAPTSYPWAIWSASLQGSIPQATAFLRANTELGWGGGQGGGVPPYKFCS